MRRALLLTAPFFSLLALTACPAPNPNGGNGGMINGGNGGGGEGGGDGGLNFGGFGGGNTGGGINQFCDPPPTLDYDGDGWSVLAGDCNDCDPNVNPGAIEVATVPDENGNLPPTVDEDCDGVIDNVIEEVCDDNLALDDFAGLHAARAIELCHISNGPLQWGVASSQWVRADGTTPLQATRGMGILPKFGDTIVPQKGASMLGISSGYARDALDPNQACGYNSCNHAFEPSGPGNPNPGLAPGAQYCDGAAPCFPQNTPACPVTNTINDDVSLKLVLRSPTNATGFKYRFRFFSFEYPEWVCTTFNDQFVALVTPPPVGAKDSNITFDSQGNVMSVNVGFFDVCDGCPAGPGDMAGTGWNTWNDAGGTLWLETQAPIGKGEEFELRFAIWDSGDSAYDSIALIDDFAWIANGGTVQIITQVPN